VVQVGGHRESELCGCAWFREFDTKPPEVVGDDIKKGSGFTVEQNIGVRVQVAPFPGHIQIVSLLVTVPRSDRLDSKGASTWSSNAAAAEVALRAIFALVAISPLLAAWDRFAVLAGHAHWASDAFVVFDASVHGRAEHLTITLPRDFLDVASIPEAEGVVHGFLRESNGLGASMVTCRFATLAASEFAVVIAVVGVIRRAGPTFAILRISCPQMVQTGSKLEIELGIVAWRIKLYCKVPEIVGDDLDVSTCRAVTKRHGISVKLTPLLSQINVVAPLAGVPRLDICDTISSSAVVRTHTIANFAISARLAIPLAVHHCVRGARPFAVATIAVRTVHALVGGSAVFCYTLAHGGAVTFHGKIGNRSSVTEAESVVPGALGETDRPSPSVIFVRVPAFAASETSLFVVMTKVV